MKKILISSILLACAVNLQACGDDGNGNQNNECKSVCKDANTLTQCQADGSSKDVNCPQGCDTAKNQCKANSATVTCSDWCKDINTLEKCKDDGTKEDINCPNGCDAATNTCKGEICVDVCKDANTLEKCKADGTKETVNCPNGCDTNKKACKTNAGDYPEPPRTCKENVNSTCISPNTSYACSDWWATEDGEYDLYIQHCADNRSCKDGVCATDNQAKCGSNYCKDLHTMVECKLGVPTEKTCASGELCIDRECLATDIKTCSQESDCAATETCHDGICYLKSNMELKVGDACQWNVFKEYCKDGIEYKCGYDLTVETVDCADYNGCSLVVQRASFSKTNSTLNAACRGETELLKACDMPGVVQTRCYNNDDPKLPFYYSLGSVCVRGTDGKMVYQTDREETNCPKKCNEDTGFCN